MDSINKKSVAKFLVAGMLITGVSFVQPANTEASWLGDLLGSAISSGGKGTASKRELKDSEKLLFNAIRNNDLELAKTCIDRGADVNVYNPNGQILPIDAAMEQHNYDMIDLLIAHGADPEGWIDYTNGHKGETHYYIFKADLKHIPYWVEHGFNVNKKTNRGCDILGQVCAMNDIMVPSQQDRYEAIKYLVEKGADVNYQPDHDIWLDKYLPLCWVASRNDVASLKLLLEHGADPHKKNREGKTALDCAIDANARDCIKILMAY